MNTIAPPAAEAVDESIIDEIIARHPNPTGDLLNVLEDLQEAHPNNYLPRTTLRTVADKMGVAASRVFSVVTFYSFFNLEPQGKHTVVVCRGTACHTRGSRQLLQCLCRASGRGALRDEEAYTTPNGQMTVRTVACFGQCALAPVVAIDEDIHGYVTDVRLGEYLKELTEIGS
jgi:NADH-quinone oxidoreductase subunit E